MDKNDAYQRAAKIKAMLLELKGLLEIDGESFTIGIRKIVHDSPKATKKSGQEYGLFELYLQFDYDETES